MSFLDQSVFVTCCDISCAQPFHDESREDFVIRSWQHKEDIAGVLCGYFEHQRRVQFEVFVVEPLQTITAILPGSKWSCLLLRIVLQDALSEVTKIYPCLKLRVFVDDVTALVKGRNIDVAQMAKK